MKKILQKIITYLVNFPVNEPVAAGAIVLVVQEAIRNGWHWHQVLYGIGAVIVRQVVMPYYKNKIKKPEA